MYWLWVSIVNEYYVKDQMRLHIYIRTYVAVTNGKGIMAFILGEAELEEITWAVNKAYQLVC